MFGLSKWWARGFNRQQAPSPTTQPAPVAPPPTGTAATGAEIQDMMQTMLGRSTSDAHIQELQASGAKVSDVVNILRHSMELRANILEEAANGQTRLDNPAGPHDVRHLFNLLLRRDINEEGIASFLAGKPTVTNVMQVILASSEFQNASLLQNGLSYTGTIDGYRYRLPNDLEVSPTRLSKVMLIGSCLMEAWHTTLENHYPETAFDYILFNNASDVPQQSAAEIASYDFQFVQIPLRSVLPESTYLTIRYSDQAAYEHLFATACARLEQNLDAALRHNAEHGLTSFVTNFYATQQNPVGRMQRRYSLQNMTHFIERLNQHMADYIDARRNVFMLDFDGVMNTFGRKYGGDDLVYTLNHGSLLTGIASEKDGARLEPVGDTGAFYGPQLVKYLCAPFEEARAMLRTIKQTDSVKLVIFDLDDTLWRGVAAELDDVDPTNQVEGWPMGVLEAVSYLWRRGIMVAIVSKNDMTNVATIWDKLYGAIFPLDRFVKVAVNWRPKAENIDEIMKSVNLLPNSVLFVDDNPVERAAVKAAFPEIRVMDQPVVHWRRILLWAPELQRAVLTEEAVARTEMVQAQIKRDTDRVSMGKSEFLASLNLKVTATEISDPSDRKFDRCFELINKTNQFNTTGKRWSPGDAEAFLARGGYFVAVEVRDIYTQYGLTGVIAVVGDTIEQFVLSCRVFGMQVELGAVSAAVNAIRHRGFTTVRGLAMETPKNLLSRTIFADCGFTQGSDGVWVHDTGSVPVPAHIGLSSPAHAAPQVPVPAE